jgi:hypothetical protein
MTVTSVHKDAEARTLTITTELDASAFGQIDDVLRADGGPG